MRGPLSLRLLLSLAGCGLSLAGCNQASIGETIYTEADLPCAALVDDVWTLTAWPGGGGDMDGGVDCGFLPLPGRERVVIPHGLGREPGPVLIYISFQPDGVGATLASGDAARIVDVNASSITLENHTAQDFYIQVILE